MALRLIKGRSGSGKSTYVMEQIAAALQANPRKKMILLLPEQATFYYQYELINHYGLHGVLSLQILSFQRLARIVLQETGGLAKQQIDELGQQMILRKLMLQQEKQLPFLNSAAHRNGCLEKIRITFADFEKYQITAQMITDIVQNRQDETLCLLKLKEISVLYNRYEEYLRTGYMDSAGSLSILIEKLKDYVLFSDTEIWIDEFHDFTPQEYGILEQLLLQSPMVQISLVNDTVSEDIRERQTFYTTEKTGQILIAIAEKHRIPLLPVLCLQKNYRQSNREALLHLEEHYAKITSKKMMGRPEGLQIIQGQNRQSEVDFAARTIRRLCREQGYHYADIGIFVRDFTSYELLLQTTLVDYQIPYFIDQKLPMRQHPLTELLLTVLDIVQGDWSYTTMFRYLKTGLLPYVLSEIDELENLVLQYGIQGKIWYGEEAWLFGPEEQQPAIDQLRRSIAQPLARLQRQLQDGQPVAAMIAALYQYLEEIGLDKALEQLCQQAAEQELLDIAQTHQQIWDKLILIFDQMTEILGGEGLLVSDFSALLNTAFTGLDLGLIPSSLDQVLIGSLTHSRSRNLKAAFILGVNEGIFPANQPVDGFFSELEQQALQQLGLNFMPSTMERLSDEELAVYLSCTKGGEYLYYSYALSDEEGKGLRPSSVIARIHQLFPDLKETFVQWPPEKNIAAADELLVYLEEPQKVLGLLGSHLSGQREESAAVWTAAYRWYQQSDIPLFAMVQESLFHQRRFDQQKLTAADQLYGKPLRLSVSAIERYQMCPYSYFLSYGLQARERKQYRVDSLDIGQFYHLIMEQFTRECMVRQLSWQDLTKEQVSEMIAQLVEQLAPQLQHEILLSSGRYRYLQHRLQKTAERSAHILWEHGQHGAFKPVALEADFGSSPDCALPGLHVDLQDGTKLQLAGRIDRIEEAVQGNCCYLRVIDFKTGTKGLTLTEIYYGLKIQLLTYLQVVLAAWRRQSPEGQQVIPVGVLYYFFRNSLQPTSEILNDREAFALYLKDMLPKGLLTADLSALLLADRQLDVGRSLHIPVNLLKAAEPYLAQPDTFQQLENPLSIFAKGSQGVVTLEQLELLLQHVERTIIQAGNEIWQGNIAIRPCRLKAFTGCQYCQYGAICQLDTRKEGKECYRQLLPLDNEWIWQSIKKGGIADDAVDSRAATGH